MLLAVKVEVVVSVLFWNNSIKVDILGYSDYHLDASIEEQNLEKWRMTCVYGETHTHLRHKTWSTLKNCSTLSDLPWLCIGEFNEVLRPEEHQGIWQRSNVQIQAF